MTDVSTIEGACEFVEDNVLPALQTGGGDDFRPFALALCRLDDELDRLSEPRIVDVTCGEVDHMLDEQQEEETGNESLLNFAAWVRSLLMTYDGIGVIVCCKVEAAPVDGGGPFRVIVVTLEHEGGERSWHAKVDRLGSVAKFEAAPGRWETGLLSRMLPKRWLN